MSGAAGKSRSPEAPLSDTSALRGGGEEELPRCPDPWIVFSEPGQPEEAGLEEVTSAGGARKRGKQNSRRTARRRSLLEGAGGCFAGHGSGGCVSLQGPSQSSRERQCGQDGCGSGCGPFSRPLRRAFSLLRRRLKSEALLHAVSAAAPAALRSASGYEKLPVEKLQ